MSFSLRKTRLVRLFIEKPRYVWVALIASGIMLFVYLFTQVVGNLRNLDVWVANVPLFNAFLLGIFVVLFGVGMAYQVHLWRSPKTCSIGKRAVGTGTNGIGTLAIFLVAQCPACASLGAAFLPISALTFVGQNTFWFNALSVGLVVFTLYHLGALQPMKGAD